MSIQANKTMVGVFVLAALVVAVSALLFLGGGELFDKGNRFILYFPKSVKGLDKGAPVLLKGVEVGTVKDISLEYDAQDQTFCTAVTLEISDRIHILEGKNADKIPQPRKDGVNREFIDMLIQRGLRAQLGLQSMLTGRLQVELDFHPDTPVNLCGWTEDYIELPTIPSPLEQISSTIEKIPLDKIMEEVLLAVQGIEKMVNGPTTRETLDELNAILKELHAIIGKANKRAGPMGEKADAVLTETHELLSRLNEQVTPLAQDLKGLLAETRDTVRKAQGKIDPLSEELSGTLAETRQLVRHVNEKVDPLTEKAIETADAAQAALNQLDQVLATLHGLVPEDSALAWQLSKTLDALTRAMDSLHDLADYWKRNPESLLFGRDE